MPPDPHPPLNIAPDPDALSSSTAVVRDMRARGFTADLLPREGGRLRCSHCGQSSGAAEFGDLEEERLEGASDPDDMLLVVAARCPNCGTGGTVVLGYGPEASGADSDVVAALIRWTQPAPSGHERPRVAGESDG